MDPFLILFLVVLVGIILYKNFFSHKATIKRKLKNTTVKQLSQFKDDDVAKIVGEIHLVDKPLLAPLSKRNCGYYFIRVEERVSSGDSTQWKTLVKEADYCSYLIKDGDYYAFINTGNLKAYIVQDRNYNSGFWEGTSKKLEEFLNSRGEKSKGFLGFNKTIRYSEGILEAGEKVALYGKGVWKNATSLGLPKEYGTVLEVTPSKGEAVFLSDDYETTLNNIRVVG